MSISGITKHIDKAGVLHRNVLLCCDSPPLYNRSSLNSLSQHAVRQTSRIMASFAVQRCSPVSGALSRPRTSYTTVPTLQRRAVRVKSLGDMLDVGRNERKALLHAFYHDLEKAKLVRRDIAHTAHFHVAVPHSLTFTLSHVTTCPAVQHHGR